MAKSIFIAYILWLFGGILGLHHFYLGRDRHAFTWFATLGGVFGLGWLREFARLGEYVQQANQTPEYIDKRVLEMRLRKQPPYNSTRVAGELIMGTLFGYLVTLALPPVDGDLEMVHRWGLLVVPFAIAVGVHLVGNIGMERGSLIWPVIASYLACFAVLFETKAIPYAAVLAAFAFNWKSRDWVRQPVSESRLRKNLCARLSILTICALLYFGLFGSFLFFNAKYTSPDGTEHTFREGVDNFFHSKAWLDLKNTMRQLKDYVDHHGWQFVFAELLAAMDPYGEARAYQVLELKPDATLAEINTRYRKLSREWHPDKHRDPEKKLVAEKRFIEIAQAYEKLSKMKSASSRSHEREEF